jgi:hypothetical protein
LERNLLGGWWGWLIMVRFSGHNPFIHFTWNLKIVYYLYSMF